MPYQTETNQELILADKVRLKKAYTNKVHASHAQSHSVPVVPPIIAQSSVVGPKIETPNAPVTQIKSIILTLTHATETFQHEYNDSNGAKRAWKGHAKTVYNYAKNYEVVSKITSLSVNKTMLKPHMDTLQKLVDSLHALTLKRSNYHMVAQKMSDLKTMLTTRLQALDENSQNEVSHSVMLDVLRHCQDDIETTKTDAVIAQHRGFARNTPILRAVLQALDILANVLQFLEQKIGRVICGHVEPVYSDATTFYAAMFKPARTNSLLELDKLTADIQYYIRDIDSKYAHAAVICGTASAG